MTFHTEEAPSADKVVEHDEVKAPLLAALPLAEHVAAKFRTFGVLAGAGVAVIGILSFARSLFNPSLFESRPAPAALALTTALGFALSASALLARRNEQASSRARLFACVSAVLVLALGIGELIYYFTSSTPRQSVALHMAPMSAIVFVLMGLGLYFVDSEDRFGRRPAQTLFLMVALFTIAALGVNLFGSFTPRNSAPFAAMTWQTALLFIVLSLGALSIRPTRGSVRTITADAAGGVVARRLLPAALLAPLALCILLYLGYVARLYEAAFGLGLLTTLNSAVLTVLVWRTAGALNESDAVSRSAHIRLIAHQAEIEGLNERLRSAMAETHHRVRNNLQIISALADLQVMRDQDSVPISEMHRIGSQVQALAAVHDLLTRDAKAHLGADTLSVDEVLERLAALLQQAVAGRTIQVESDHIRVTSRQASAIAVVANELIINALKNSPRDVEVRFHASGQAANLEVLDRGFGFPAEFDPKVHSGTGLELVHQMAVWDLAGNLEFMNREGGGACVRVTLPLGSRASMRAS